MKNSRKTITVITAIVLTLALSGAALAGVLLYKQWANPTVFRGHIEQPTGETKLILTVNGIEIEEDADLTDGDIVFPLLAGDVASETAGHWTDENGREAVSTPTMTLSTSNGSRLDGIYCQIQIHAGPAAHVVQGIADAMKFGLDAVHCIDGVPMYGSCCSFEATALEDCWMASEWIYVGDLLAGETIQVDLSAWATQVAEGDFYVEVVFATGEYIEG